MKILYKNYISFNDVNDIKNVMNKWKIENWKNEETKFVCVFLENLQKSVQNENHF